MGFIGDWIKAKNMQDPVRGTLQVTASSYPPNDAMSANYSINGIVSGDGIAPTAVQHSGIARTKKWPQSGQVLPVTVDRADPTRIHIEWDEVPDSWKRAQDTAKEMAEWMRAGHAATPAATPGVTVTEMPGAVIDASGIPGLRDEVTKLAMSGGTPQQIVDALRAHGVQVPDAASVQMMPTAVPGMPGAAATPQHDEDPAERLKKLEQLKTSGLITEDEYEAQRKRVIEDV